MLDILVENIGSVNYGARIPDQRKGIIGNAMMGKAIFLGWEMHTPPLDPHPTSLSTSSTLSPISHTNTISVLNISSPIFYTGTFDTSGDIGDTFYHLTNWTKGVVWVNSENVGRD